MGFGLGDLFSVGGTVLNLLGQKSAADAQSDQARKNAALQQKESEYQQWLGNQKVSDLDAYKKRLIGAQKVRFAKAGVRIDDSTALAVAADNEMQYSKDLAYLKQNTKFNVERAQAGAQSFNEQSKSIQTTSTINMSRTLLQFGEQASKYW